MKAYIIALLVAIFGLTLIDAGKASAAALTWDGEGATNNWSECANWTTNACPTSADTVTFNATSVKNSTIDPATTATVSTMTVTSAYTGVITQGRALTVTLLTTFGGGTYNGGTDPLILRDLTMTGGIFNAPTNMSALGNFMSMDISGGIFTAPSGLLTVRRTFIVQDASQFVHNGGTVFFSHSGNGSRHDIRCGDAVFNLVQIDGVKRIWDDCVLPLGHNPHINSSPQSWPALYLSGGTLTGTGTLTVGDLSSSHGLSYDVTSPIVGFSGLNTGRLTASGSTLDFSDFEEVLIRVNLTIGVSSTLLAPDLLTVEAGDFNFDATSTFVHNDGEVKFTGTNNLVKGSNTFFYLTKDLATAGELTFEAGTTQTVEGLLKLSGASEAEPLVLKSQVDGSPWFIHVLGATDNDYLDISDSESVGGPIYAANSVFDSTVGWVFGEPPLPPQPPTPPADESNSATQSLADTGMPLIIISALIVTAVIAGIKLNLPAGKKLSFRSRK